MKKVISLVLVLLLLTLMTACGKSKNDGIIVKKGSENSQSDEGFVSQIDATTSSDSARTVLDPFDGIKFETSGISPKCTVTINNQNCSIDAQSVVNYSLDKEFYANGETAIITATISGYDAVQKYLLSSETTQWNVENQPEYIMSADDIDLSQIKPEVEDFIDATIAKETHAGVRWELLGASISGADEVKDLKAGDIYFQSLKLQKELPDDSCYNYLTFSYSGKYVSASDGNGSVFTCVSAANLIKYPDGTLKWGTESTEGFDFKAEGSTKGMEDCIEKAVIVHSDNYNITKLDKKS